MTSNWSNTHTHVVLYASIAFNGFSVIHVKTWHHKKLSITYVYTFHEAFPIHWIPFFLFAPLFGRPFMFLYVFCGSCFSLECHYCNILRIFDTRWFREWYQIHFLSHFFFSWNQNREYKWKWIKDLKWKNFNIEFQFSIRLRLFLGTIDRKF